MGYSVKVTKRKTGQQFELKRGRLVAPGLGTYYPHLSSAARALIAFKQSIGSSAWPDWSFRIADLRLENYKGGNK